MAGRKHRKASQAGTSSTSAPIDRIPLLPQELRLRIYSFIFAGPITLYIEKRWQDSETQYSSILTMRRDVRYQKSRQRCPGRVWPEPLEKAFFQGTYTFTILHSYC